MAVLVIADGLRELLIARQVVNLLVGARIHPHAVRLVGRLRIAALVLSRTERCHRRLEMRGLDTRIRPVVAATLGRVTPTTLLGWGRTPLPVTLLGCLRRLSPLSTLRGLTPLVAALLLLWRLLRRGLRPLRLRWFRVLDRVNTGSTEDLVESARVVDGFDH